MRSLHRLLAAALAFTTLWTVLSVAPVLAHGPPTPLNFWGAFGRRVARCQRIIGRAAAVCGLRAWNAQRDCQLTNLHGGICDEEATSAAIEAARLDAVDAVQAGCTDQQALMLVFLGRFEAQTDVVRFCRQVEDAAISAVFRPVGAETPVPPSVARCVTATTLATTKLLRRGFDSRQYVLDRIAQRSFSPTDKLAMVAESTAAIGRAAGALEAGLDESCSADEFSEAYGQDAATLLSLIATRADCLAGSTYAQGGIVCPALACGNGMVEGDAVRDEECDDGNLDSGDGCSATCARE